MALSIRTNIASLNAQKNLAQTEGMLNSSLSKLSSGFRITKAGDDAAGLGISSNLNAQVKSYNQAARNASDAVSVIQTAEGSLNETTNILTRLRELAMQSASSGVGNTERGYIQNEVTQLVSEISRIAESTEYNGVKLVDGVVATLTFQVGIRNSTDTADRISVNTVDATTTKLGVATLELTGSASSQAALATIDTAIETISAARATLGAAGNRFNAVTNTIRTASENLSAAHSRIKDVDVAEETSAMSRAQILAQAGVSILAQANQMPQMAMKLLG
jgi:flagellin